MKSRNMLSVGLATMAIVVSTALAAVAQPGWIAGDATNVRDRPTTQGRIVTYTYRGNQVEILTSQINPADGYGWYEVKLPNRTRGWVRADLVSLSTGTNRYDIPRNIGGGDRPNTGSDTDIGRTVRLHGTNGGQVNIRRSPGLDSVRAFAGNHGDRVYVDNSYRDRDGIWLHVVYPMALPDVVSSGWVQRNLTR
jgi:uncharacterized protein YgiM (DUF1202 family)